MSKDPEDQALTHWDYVQGVLEQELFDTEVMALTPKDYLRVIGHHFRTAFVHGYKHGKESTDAKV